MSATVTVQQKNFGSLCLRNESFFSADCQVPNVRNVCTNYKLETVQNKFVKEISFQKIARDIDLTFKNKTETKHANLTKTKHSVSFIV